MDLASLPLHSFSRQELASLVHRIVDHLALPSPREGHQSASSMDDSGTSQKGGIGEQSECRGTHKGVTEESKGDAFGPSSGWDLVNNDDSRGRRRYTVLLQSRM